MYINDTLYNYIFDLAAKQPTPGGGSAAGLCGALGAALLEMVGNFTIGNERYKDVEKDVQAHLTSLKKIREEFSLLIDKDVETYSAIRSAFKTKDKKVIDKALKDGYRISLNICKLSMEAMNIGAGLSIKGNLNLITDVGCGAEFLNAAFNSGIFNAEINLKGIGDKDFIANERAVLEALKKETVTLYKKAVSKTKERMK